jgi:hypothetical protein
MEGPCCSGRSCPYWVCEKTVWARRAPLGRQAEFPREAFGRVGSTIIAVNQFTYSFGPGILGWLHDAFGSYQAALAGCLALQLAAVAIVLLDARMFPRRA